MVESRIQVVFVTHLYDLAHGLFAAADDGTLFLRAERRGDGQRTFRLIAGEPLPTSYGEDSYRRIFGRPLPSWSSTTAATNIAKPARRV